MGNVSGKKEAESSGSKNGDEEVEYMEYTHSGSYQKQHAFFRKPMVPSPHQSPRACNSPVSLSPQAPMIPFERSGETAQNQSVDYAEMPTENCILSIITWNYGGNQVAIEGSWDHWETRELLQRNSKAFTIMKLLPSGVYRYRFVVDGHYRYDPDLPQAFDDAGNVFNVLDLQDHAPEVLDNVYIAEGGPVSPASSYNSLPFSLEDFQEKLPDLPPLLQRTPLDQPSTSTGDTIAALQMPLPPILNHLFIEKGHAGQSMVALGSTLRFRKKYVTTVLYKSLKNLNKG